MTKPTSNDYPPPHQGEGPDGTGVGGLHHDQQPVPEQVDADTASDVDENDPHKAEKLTKAGRDIDPDEGGD